MSVDRDDTASARLALLQQVRDRRVVVCVGSGGVGKTTTAAALGLAAAAIGRKTLVITIDPARRLANALGLDALSHEPQLVDHGLVMQAARQLSSSSSPSSSPLPLSPPPTLPLPLGQVLQPLQSTHFAHWKQDLWEHCHSPSFA